MPLVGHEMKLHKGTKPVKQWSPLSPKLWKALHDIIEKQEKQGIIERSDSERFPPIVMVGKSNGSYCTCVDLRPVNKVSAEDAYPLPFMEVILNKLRSAKYIPSLDLSSAYHQIRLHKNSRYVTAFTAAGRGLWQYIIDCINDTRLTTNRQKSQSCQREMKYLGFIIDEKGISINPDKTASPHHYTRPKTLKQSR